MDTEDIMKFYADTFVALINSIEKDERLTESDKVGIKLGLLEELYGRTDKKLLGEEFH